MLSNRQNLGLFLGLLGVIVFAGSLPASRVAVSEVDPYFLTAMRATLAGLGGLLLLTVTGRRWPPREAWWPLIGLRSHDRARLSAAVGAGDGYGAVLAWRRDPRHHAAGNDRGSSRDRGRTPKPRLLDRSDRRIGTGDGVRDLPERRLFAFRRRHTSAGCGCLRRRWLYLFRKARRHHAGMGSDFLGGGIVAAAFARRAGPDMAGRCRARFRRASGSRSSTPD